MDAAPLPSCQAGEAARGGMHPWGRRDLRLLGWGTAGRRRYAAMSNTTTRADASRRYADTG